MGRLATASTNRLPLVLLPALTTRRRWGCGGCTAKWDKGAWNIDRWGAWSALNEHGPARTSRWCMVRSLATRRYSNHCVYLPRELQKNEAEIPNIFQYSISREATSITSNHLERNMATQKGHHGDESAAFQVARTRNSAPLLVAAPLLETLPRVELEATCRPWSLRFQSAHSQGSGGRSLQKLKTGTKITWRWYIKYCSRSFSD